MIDTLSEMSQFKEHQLLKEIKLHYQTKLEKEGKKKKSKEDELK